MCVLICVFLSLLSLLLSVWHPFIKVDGFGPKQRTLVICATNRKQDLDSALVRRFDLSLRFDPPGQEGRQAIFARYAQQLPVSELGALAGMTEGMAGRDIKELCQQAERRWASKMLRKLVTVNTPSFAEYVEAAQNRQQHMSGVGDGGVGRDVTRDA